MYQQFVEGQPDDDRPRSPALRWAASMWSSTARRRSRSRSISFGQLLSRPRDQARAGPDDPARTTIAADGAAGGRHQPQATGARASAAIPTLSARSSPSTTCPVTIVGVLPPEFTGVQQTVAEAARYRRAALARLADQRQRRANARLSQPTFWWLQIMGRLKPGMTAAAGRRQPRRGLPAHGPRRARLATCGSRPTARACDCRTTGIGPRCRSCCVDSGSRGIYDVNTTELRAASHPHAASSCSCC